MAASQHLCEAPSFGQHPTTWPGAATGLRSPQRWGGWDEHSTSGKLSFTLIGSDWPPDCYLLCPCARKTPHGSGAVFSPQQSHGTHSAKGQMPVGKKAFSSSPSLVCRVLHPVSSALCELPRRPSWGRIQIQNAPEGRGLALGTGSSPSTVGTAPSVDKQCRGSEMALSGHWSPCCDRWMLTCTSGESQTSRSMQGGGQLGQNPSGVDLSFRAGDASVGLAVLTRAVLEVTQKGGQGKNCLWHWMGQTRLRMRAAHAGGCASSILDQHTCSLWEASKSQLSCNCTL